MTSLSCTINKLLRIVYAVVKSATFNGKSWVQASILVTPKSKPTAKKLLEGTRIKKVESKTYEKSITFSSCVGQWKKKQKKQKKGLRKQYLWKKNLPSQVA